jgi:hydroxylamine dehydrogenase
MKTLAFFVAAVFLAASFSLAGEPPVSSETQGCIGCHSSVTPGIVKDWMQSRHSKTTPAEGMAKSELKRRISAKEVAAGLKAKVVGCYECHGLNPERHKDNFDHYGYKVNVVVSPGDCSTCHPVEAEQYSGSKKANAWGNLQYNPVYLTLVNTVIGLKQVSDDTITMSPPSHFTRQEACFGCHGTKVEARGMKTVQTAMGAIKVPDLTNWPNQGVGRLNPDGTKGACTSCHPRHSFSIEVARKPYTCSQCHLEPDVPAWNVYDESKHGDILLSEQNQWNFTDVPWTVGEDFLAPSCSTCHMSLLVSPDGSVIAERSHDFGARLWVRLFGLIYSHAQPKKGDTSIIRNADGLPLPTTFTGEPAAKYLIDKQEQARRKGIMMSVCKGCHSTDWTEMHFAKLDSTLQETDKMTLAATKLISEAWRLGIADKSNPFDEALEQKWIKQWLFFGNSVRYSSAMTGAPDYAAFKYGWWDLTNNLQEMRDKIEMKKKLMHEERSEH